MNIMQQVALGEKAALEVVYTDLGKKPRQDIL
jgi:hypothetical protein